MGMGQTVQSHCTKAWMKQDLQGGAMVYVVIHLSTQKSMLDRGGMEFFVLFAEYSYIQNILCFDSVFAYWYTAETR